MRFYRIVLGPLICLIITACTTITQEIQHIGNDSLSHYPAAKALDLGLEKPPTVNLSRYRSVHTRRKEDGVTIAFAASGGGYRAANFTLGVLLGLEKLHSPQLSNNLLQEIDYFSTVSGGGFGVGYYLTQLHNHQGVQKPFSLEKSVRMMLANDKKEVNPLRQDLTPYLFFGEQRGLALEKKINETLLATPEGGLILGDIFVPAQSAQNVQMPYWVTNAMIFQNAAMFPFSPDVLARYRVTDFFHNGQRYQVLGDVTRPYYAYNVPLAVGLTASASVPFALPVTTLISDGCEEGQCYLQLLDGGMADNLGIYTALAFLLQDKSKIKILVIADASRSGSEPYSRLSIPPKNMVLLWRVLTASVDANRERIKPSIHLVARDLLCDSGASHVIVIYLDLSQYKGAQQIGTELNMTENAQRFLLQIGQNAVLKNETIQTFLTQITQGHLTLGECHALKR